MEKSTMSETVWSRGHGGTAAAMMQNEQTTKEHSTLEQQSQDSPIGMHWPRVQRVKVRIGVKVWVGVSLAHCFSSVLCWRHSTWLTWRTVYVNLLCGRSILTVPWIELGGVVTITCPKTGYSAQIDFETKVCSLTTHSSLYLFGNLIDPITLLVSHRVTTRVSRGKYFQNDLVCEFW